jgi:flagellar L-ring protein precursor FlgH
MILTSVRVSDVIRGGQLGKILVASLLLCANVQASDKNKPGAKDVKTPEASPIDAILAATAVSAAPNPALYPGSTFVGGAILTDLASDVRAKVVGDLVTVVVLDQASATSQGATSQKRASSLSASVSSLFGKKSASNALNNLASTTGAQQLDGQGATSRQTTVSTTLSARVIRVLPNGDLVIEGSKLISINSEYQTVLIRGIVRPVDLGQSNSLSSNQVSDLELRINGHGVVNDAIRRPNFLYRLLMGIVSL